jgi:hypothetical protein
MEFDSFGLVFLVCEYRPNRVAKRAMRCQHDDHLYDLDET